MNPTVVKHLCIISALFLFGHLFGQKQTKLEPVINLPYFEKSN